MYGLPADVDLGFLVGKSLFQVCIGMHDLMLAFDDVSITVTSSIECRRADGAVTKVADFPEGAPALLAYLHRKVVAAAGATNGTLELRFADGSSLVLLDDSEHYECYVINREGKPPIVV